MKTDTPDPAPLTPPRYQAVRTTADPTVWYILDTDVMMLDTEPFSDRKITEAVAAKNRDAMREVWVAELRTEVFRVIGRYEQGGDIQNADRLMAAFERVFPGK